MDSNERQRLKAAKASYKASSKKEKEQQLLYPRRRDDFHKNNRPQWDGLVQGEYELRDDYPVNYDYCYVVQNSAGTARVIMSEIRGTVKQLKHRNRVLDALPIVKVYNCNMAARNLL